MKSLLVSVSLTLVILTGVLPGFQWTATYQDPIPIQDLIERWGATGYTDRDPESPIFELMKVVLKPNKQSEYEPSCYYVWHKSSEAVFRRSATVWVPRVSVPPFPVPPGTNNRTVLDNYGFVTTQFAADTRVHEGYHERVARIYCERIVGQYETWFMSYVSNRFGTSAEADAAYEEDMREARESMIEEITDWDERNANHDGIPTGWWTAPNSELTSRNPNWGQPMAIAAQKIEMNYEDEQVEGSCD